MKYVKNVTIFIDKKLENLLVNLLEMLDENNDLKIVIISNNKQYIRDNTIEFMGDFSINVKIISYYKLNYKIYKYDTIIYDNPDENLYNPRDKMIIYYYYYYNDFFMNNEENIIIHNNHYKYKLFNKNKKYEGKIIKIKDSIENYKENIDNFNNDEINSIKIPLNQINNISLKSAYIFINKLEYLRYISEDLYDYIILY
jgi:hypothetical protein